MQTTYPLRPARSKAGMHADTFPFGFISRALATRQTEEVTFGTTDGTYTVTVDGVLLATYVAASKTATQIRDAVLALVQAAGGGVVATASSTNKMLLDNLDNEDVGFVLAVSTVAGYSVAHLVAQGEAVPFGVALVADDRAPVTGLLCRLPRLATDVTGGRFLGVAAANTANEPHALAGWPNKSMPDILRTGHIYVLAEGTGVEGVTLFTRFAAGGGGSQLGAWRADADTASAVVVPGCRALESWSAAGPVLAEVTPQTP